MAIPLAQITGLVLAGGRGSRMGGLDKGLQPLSGRPLALHALERLAPQVGPLAVNANRHLEAYARFGVPVWPDALPDHPGPLAGWLEGLRRCATPWLVSIPCDTPHFPPDLVARLAEAVESADADLAMAVIREEGRPRRQPVFTLMKRSLANSLAAQLQGGRRRVDLWTDTQRGTEVVFDDAEAFFNVNTLEDLQRLEAGKQA